ALPLALLRDLRLQVADTRSHLLDRLVDPGGFLTKSIELAGGLCDLPLLIGRSGTSFREPARQIVLFTSQSLLAIKIDLSRLLQAALFDLQSFEFRRQARHIAFRVVFSDLG